MGAHPHKSPWTPHKTPFQREGTGQFVARQMRESLRALKVRLVNQVHCLFTAEHAHYCRLNTHKISRYGRPDSHLVISALSMSGIHVILFLPLVLSSGFNGKKLRDYISGAMPTWRPDRIIIRKVVFVGTPTLQFLSL